MRGGHIREGSARVFGGHLPELPRAGGRTIGIGFGKTFVTVVSEDSAKISADERCRGRILSIEALGPRGGVCAGLRRALCLRDAGKIAYGKKSAITNSSLNLR